MPPEERKSQTNLYNMIANVVKSTGHLKREKKKNPNTNNTNNIAIYMRNGTERITSTHSVL